MFFKLYHIFFKAFSSFIGYSKYLRGFVCFVFIYLLFSNYLYSQNTSLTGLNSSYRSANSHENEEWIDLNGQTINVMPLNDNVKGIYAFKSLSPYYYKVDSVYLFNPTSTDFSLTPSKDGSQPEKRDISGSLPQSKVIVVIQPQQNFNSGKRKLGPDFYNKSSLKPLPKVPLKKFEIGARVGLTYFHGDVIGKPDIAVGFDGAKPIGIGSALRGCLVMGRFSGQNVKPNFAYDGTVDAQFNYHDITYWNFQTWFVYTSYHLRLNVNNLGLLREPNIQLYGFFGPGFMFYFVKSNLSDANGRKYDYSNGLENAKMDDDYESLLLSNDSSYNSIQPIAIFTAGMGVLFKISADFSLGCEYVFQNEMIPKTDMWDGRRYQDVPGNVLSTDYDALSGLYATILYRLGPSLGSANVDQEMNADYEEIMDLRKKIREIGSDSDGDGIIDGNDQEPFSPKGARVGTDGVTLDSDKDGIPDHKDSEPFSPYPTAVDSTGATPKGTDGVPLYLKSYIDKMLKQGAESTGQPVKNEMKLQEDWDKKRD